MALQELNYWNYPEIKTPLDVYPGKFPAGGMAARALGMYNWDAPEIKFLGGHYGGP